MGIKRPLVVSRLHPAPMANCILEETYPDEQFGQYMANLFKTVAPGDAFILGVSDNVLGTSRLNQVLGVSEMVEEHGDYPIAA